MTPPPPEFDPSQARQILREHGRTVATEYMQPFLDGLDINAMIGMADLEYDEGNHTESSAWMKRAEATVAEDDFVSPIYLSSAYERGLGAGTYDERRSKAIQMRERVAEAGNVIMQHALMSEYLFGLNGVPASKEKFTYWATKAAALGSVEAAKALTKLDKWPKVGPGE